MPVRLTESHGKFRNLVAAPPRFLGETLRCGTYQTPDTQRYFETLAGHKTVYSTSMNAEEDEDSKRLSEVGTPLVRSEKWRTLEILRSYSA
jgi:hypothetical protein